DVCSAGAHRTDDDQAGMDSNARFDAGSALRLQRMVQLAHARRDGDSGQNGSFGVVVVRAGIAEKSDDAVADILVYVAAVARDAVVADALVGAQHVAQRLGVELSGECRRADNVGEQHRQLATLAIRRSSRRRAARRRPGEIGYFAAIRERSAAGTAESGVRRRGRIAGRARLVGRRPAGFAEALTGSHLLAARPALHAPSPSE